MILKLKIGDWYGKLVVIANIVGCLEEGTKAFVKLPFPADAPLNARDWRDHVTMMKQRDLRSHQFCEES